MCIPKKSKNIIMFIVCIVLCYGCDDIDTADFTHESALAVNAQIFQGDDQMQFTVTQTVGIGDTLFYDKLNLDDVNVYLDTPDQGTIQGKISPGFNQINGLSIPLWQFDYEEYISGSEYILRAEKDGFESVIASVIVPSQPTIVDVQFDPSDSDESVIRDRFELTISDPGDQENYYYIRAVEKIADDQGFEFDIDYRLFDAPINPIDESFLENRITSFSDQGFNGNEHTIILYGERVRKEQTEISVLLYAISKDHYDFIQNFEKFNNDSPISEPVIFNSNIIGGHGIFAITSVADTFDL